MKDKLILFTIALACVITLRAGILTAVYTSKLIVENTVIYDANMNNIPNIDILSKREYYRVFPRG